MSHVLTSLTRPLPRSDYFADAGRYVTVSFGRRSGVADSRESRFHSLKAGPATRIPKFDVAGALTQLCTIEIPRSFSAIVAMPFAAGARIPMGFAPRSPSAWAPIVCQLCLAVAVRHVASDSSHPRRRSYNLQLRPARPPVTQKLSSAETTRLPGGMADTSQRMRVE